MEKHTIGISCAGFIAKEMAKKTGWGPLRNCPRGLGRLAGRVPKKTQSERLLLSSQTTGASGSSNMVVGCWFLFPKHKAIRNAPSQIFPSFFPSQNLFFLRCLVRWGRDSNQSILPHLGGAVLKNGPFGYWAGGFSEWCTIVHVRNDVHAIPHHKFVDVSFRFPQLPTLKSTQKKQRYL